MIYILGDGVDAAEWDKYVYAHSFSTNYHLAGWKEAGGAIAELRKQTHKTIDAVTKDIENFHFNKAIARIRELTNAMEKLTLTDAAVQAAQRIQLPVALAATTVHWAAGRLDLQLGLGVGALVLLGWVVGRRLARHWPTRRLRQAVAVALIAAGLTYL